MVAHQAAQRDPSGGRRRLEVVDLAPAGATIEGGARPSRAVLVALAVVALLAAAVLLLVAWS